MSFHTMLRSSLILLLVVAGSTTATHAQSPHAPAPLDQPRSGQAVGDSAVGDSAATARSIPHDNSVVVASASQPVRVRLAAFDLDEANLAQSTVTLVTPTGAAVNHAVGSDLSFTFQPSDAGLYALIVNGPQGHAAFPIAVRFANTGDSAQDLAGSAAEVRLQLFRLAPSEADRAARAFLPAVANARADLDQAFITAGAIAPSQQYRVQLSPQGRVVGQVVSLLVPGSIGQVIQGNNLLLYKDGRVVQRTVSDDQGRFVFEGVQPGYYGVIGAGPGGYAAFGLQAVAADDLAADAANPTTLVSTLAGVAGHQPLFAGECLPVVMVPQSHCPSVVAPVEDFACCGVDGCGEIVGCGCDLGVDGLGDPDGLAGFGSYGAGYGYGGYSGGGFGGGGGGGFGGGGFGGGGLLGLAGLGAAAAIAASDNDDRVIVVEASPASVLPITN